MIAATVERKTPADLASAAIAGRLQFVLADLAQVPRAALVVEGRLSDVVKSAERGRARPGWLLNVLAAVQVSHPKVMWMFAETPRLAEDWAPLARRELARCEREPCRTRPRRLRRASDPGGVATWSRATGRGSAPFADRSGSGTGNDLDEPESRR